MHSKNEIWSWPPVDASVDAMPVALEGLPQIAEVLNLHSLHDPEGEAVHGSDIPLSSSDLLVHCLGGSAMG